MRNKSVSILTEEKDKFIDEMVTKVSTGQGFFKTKPEKKKTCN
jgi:hypothetical protein